MRCVWLGLLLSGCGGLDAGAVGRDAEVVLRDWTSWQQADDHAGVVSSDGAHGWFVEVRLNAAAAGALGGPMPDGAALVVRGWDDGGEVARDVLAVMYKRADFAPDHGDWFWAAADEQGKLIGTHGILQDCLDCHVTGIDGVISAWPADRPIESEE